MAKDVFISNTPKYVEQITKELNLKSAQLTINKDIYI